MTESSSIKPQRFPAPWIGLTLTATAFAVNSIGSAVTEFDHKRDWPWFLWISSPLTLCAYVYWPICIYQIHSVLRAYTGGRYPIQPIPATGYGFVPGLNFYWIFRWPNEIVDFLNASRGEKKFRRWWPGTWLLLSIFIWPLSASLSYFIAFAVLGVLTRRIRVVVNEDFVPQISIGGVHAVVGALGILLIVALTFYFGWYTEHSKRSLVSSVDVNTVDSIQSGDQATLVSETDRYKSNEMQNESDLPSLQSAASGGDASAQFKLGFKYAKGRDVKQDYSQASSWLHKSADQDYDRAQEFLGLMYFLGEGVTLDYEKAAYWFRKAADQGNPRAQYNLGVMYSDGKGVQQDNKLAANWYKKAALQGNLSAQYNLGVMYSAGEGVVQDYQESAKWYGMAAKQGFADAQYYLGLLYSDGLGVPKDVVTAHMWFNLAAAQGHKDAREQRDVLAAIMSAKQVTEAQGRASEFTAE